MCRLNFGLLLSKLKTYASSNVRGQKHYFYERQALPFAVKNCTV